ncbi:MAG: exodeoxyribonuclease VII small subunit [Phycisphaerae bacterium]|nr:exodeoxyribonuclease VII small subunit [Phycisphaerae bacterium]
MDPINAKSLKFEDALDRLEKIVTQIEEGKVSLEESIEQYGLGIDLIKQCRAILDQAEKKIQLLGRGDGGGLEVSGELEEPE